MTYITLEIVAFIGHFILLHGICWDLQLFLAVAENVRWLLPLSVA